MKREFSDVPASIQPIRAQNTGDPQLLGGLRTSDDFFSGQRREG
jgi:hypothetical protein